MILETVRLRLRPVAMHDVDALVELDSDPAVMRFVSGGMPTPREVIEDWVLPRAQAEHRAHRTGIWTAVDRTSSAFQGWFALRTPRHSNRSEVELSYRLRRDSWGRGLATEAAHALVTMSFQEIAAERVFASTMAMNTASRRVMEKVGMRLSAIRMSEDGVLFPTSGGEVEYELLRSHWETLTMRWSEPTHRSWSPTVPAGWTHRHDGVPDLTA
ncbi:GNAT family N-acetyltransferase [Gordonia sp. SL306]|uniref:GNAT family N-acetyltransferase n=1 Tax=Gordonia sp. SL306 TaxID=2995145 RepID=UPI002272275C|nr:GNAT family N-acetyltransferase [Gordonia sp. SL306]WAC58308.1 GNAT family N-acetyltransferase [Gordonia sp. SL306]